MSKIVYNACFGGFSLSPAAVRAYAARKGITLYPMRSKRDNNGRLLLGDMEPVPENEISGWMVSWYTSPDAADGSHFWDRDIDRTDPDLIAVVEELGSEKASGECARLAISELAPGTLYRIDEYDGREAIETRDGIDWKVAQ